MIAPSATSEGTKVNTEELRTLLLEYVKSVQERDPKQQFQFNGIVTGVEEMAKKREDRGNEFYSRHVGYLTLSERNLLLQVTWDLILERVLVPGDIRGTVNSGWPFISLTEHGLKVIAELHPTPYDPDGYLARLKQDVPNLHDVVYRYLEEAVSTLRTGNLLASAVMLGAASESIFGKMREAITEAIGDENKRASFQTKARSKKMKDQINAVVGWCNNHRKQLPGEWAGTERIAVIHMVAQLIRKRRNETGHPQDPPAVPSREEMYACLMVFPEYCKNMYELWNWLDDNKGKVQ